MADHSELIAEISVVEKLPTQDRLKHAKKRRSQQLKRFQQYEKLLDKRDRKGSRPARKTSSSKRSRKKKERVKFLANLVLLEAAARNDVEEVRLLLQKGVTPDVTNEDGLTALHQCCIDDCEEMMRLLLEYGSNVNARDSELWTPLHAAATCGHLHLCKTLIERGAELLSVNADGNMPYDICEDEKTLDYIETKMAENGVTQELIDETRLSLEKSMLEDLKIMAADGKDLEYRDRFEATPLHIAAANGYLQVGEFLLEHHVNVDARDQDDWTSVHAAACWGQPVMLELLIQNGADLEAKTKTGETPFDICEDPEFKQRILEMQDEIACNKASRVTELSKRKSHNTRSGTLAVGSTSSLYSSNTSLTERHSISASIRRTSMREKSQLSWKAAREEAKYFIGAMAQEEELIENGQGEGGDTDENLPVSNIDDVKLSVSNGNDSPSNEGSPTDEKHVTMVTIKSGSKNQSKNKAQQIHHDRTNENVTTVTINEHVPLKKQSSESSNTSSSKATLTNSSVTMEVVESRIREKPEANTEPIETERSPSKNDASLSPTQAEPIQRTIKVKGTQPTTPKSVSPSRDNTIKAGAEGQPNKKGVRVEYKSKQGKSTRPHGPPIIDIAGEKPLPKSQGQGLLAVTERETNKLRDSESGKRADPSSNHNHNRLENGENIKNQEDSKTINNNKQNAQNSVQYGEAPLMKFVAQNSSEVVGYEEKKCCVIT